MNTDDRTTEQKARAVFGGRAASYTTSASHTDQAVLDRVVELAMPGPQAMVLDVATGTGHTAFALAPHAARVVGADITPEMLAEARQLTERLTIGNVDLYLANVMALPFGDGAFDIVTCRRAAHHFSPIRRALDEMWRVLKDGGRLVVDDRSVPEDDFVDATMNRLDVLHDASHVREYRPSEWRELLADACFTVDVLEAYTRHRPLSSLTKDVSPDNVAEIEEIIASLSDAERAAMDVVEKDGETWCSHWFVMAAARKTE